MNASSASATSAAARMDIEKAAQDARTMFFITCAPLTGKTGWGFCGRAATGAAENHARAERAASSAGALVALETPSGNCKLSPQLGSTRRPERLPQARI